MKAFLLLAVAGVVAITMAEGCGGAGSATSAGNGGAGASGSAGSGKSSSKATTGPGGSGTGGSGTTTSATSASTSSTGAGGSGTGGSGTTTSASSTSSSSGGAACPDESGKYAVEVDGLGCSDLLPGAPQCIEAGTVPCQIQLVSKGSGGSALNGTVAIDMSGDFAPGVVVKEGTIDRSGCTGTWNAATSQLTVDCGGMGSSQSCIATLTRTGSTCP